MKAFDHVQGERFSAVGHRFPALGFSVHAIEKSRGSTTTREARIMQFFCNEGTCCCFKVEFNRGLLDIKKFKVVFGE